MRRLHKKGVKFENVLIGFLILSVFIIGGTLMMVDMNTSYEEAGVNLSTEKYGDVYNTTADMFGIAESADEKAFQGDISEVESADATIRGSYSVIRLITGTYSLFKGITTAVAQEVGVHPALVGAAYIAFVLVIVFSLVYLVFRFIPK